MDSKIATNTRKIINEKGLKISAVASKAGYNYKVFNNILTGRKQITDIVIVQLCNALEVTPNKLFGIE